MQHVKVIKKCPDTHWHVFIWKQASLALHQAEISTLYNLTVLISYLPNTNGMRVKKSHQPTNINKLYKKKKKSSTFLPPYQVFLNLFLVIMRTLHPSPWCCLMGPILWAVAEPTTLPLCFFGCRRGRVALGFWWAQTYYTLTALCPPTTDHAV